MSHGYSARIPHGPARRDTPRPARGTAPHLPRRPAVGLLPPHSFLAGLDLETRAALLRLGVPRITPAGGVIVPAGDPAHHVVLLLRGWVTLTAHTESGRLLVLGIGHSGDLVGDDPQDAPRLATVSAGAGTITLSRLIPTAVVTRFMAAHPAALEVYCRSQCAQMRAATRQWVTARGPVALRVARLLHDQHRRFSAVRRAGRPVAIPLSQQEIAGSVDASVPSVHRALTGLRRAGIIATANPRSIIVINLRGLAAAAESTALPARAWQVGAESAESAEPACLFCPAPEHENEPR